MSQIPIEIWAHILRFCDAELWLRLRMSCKYIYNAPSQRDIAERRPVFYMVVVRMVRGRRKNIFYLIASNEEKAVVLSKNFLQSKYYVISARTVDAQLDIMNVGYIRLDTPFRGSPWTEIMKNRFGRRPLPIFQGPKPIEEIMDKPKPEKRVNKPYKVFKHDIIAIYYCPIVRRYIVSIVRPHCAKCFKLVVLQKNVFGSGAGRTAQ